MPSIRQLAGVPRELEEDFPGKFHLHKLWAIVRSWENSSSGKTRPCRVSYTKLGIELAYQMGRPSKPYSEQTVRNYLLFLREKGWIKTIQILHKPTERFTLTRQKYEKASGRPGYSGNRQNFNIFVNYAIVSSGFVFPIIQVKFATSTGGKNDALIGGVDEWGYSEKVPLNVITNVITNNSGERCSPSLLSSKEKRGLLNMKGFFETDTPNKTVPDDSLSDAQVFQKTLVAAGLLRGQRVSQSKWASQLAKTKKTYEEYPEVFDWVIRNLPEKGHFLRSMIQSPKSFHQKFMRLLEMKQRDEKKTNFDLPDDDHTELIDQIVSYIESEIPGLKTQKKDLRYAIWEMGQMLTHVSDELEGHISGRGTKTDDLCQQVADRLLDPQCWLDKMIDQLKDLQAWEKWTGRLARTKLGWSTISPKAMELVFYVIKKSSRNDLAVESKVQKIVKGVFDEVEE